MAKAKEKASPENTGIAPKTIVFAAVVIVAALAAIGYFGGFFGGIAPAQPPATLPLATPEARLLLASFDKGAALTDYTLNYTANDNGMKSSYDIAKNGSNSWVLVQGTFGKMYGFFGADNRTDTVCLEYGGDVKCAVEGNQSDMADIAASLKILRPTPLAYLNQKDDTRKLISTGAIRLEPGIADEKVGPFDTQRITYTLDYSNLTVQQMVSLGMSPNDENLLTVTDQKVVFWIDRNTGLMVKSHASYSKAGVAGFYDTEYSAASAGAGAVPQRPVSSVAPEAFVDFYKRSTSDFSERAACFAMKGAEKDTCLKSIAVNGGDWETCKLIETPSEYASCSMIVAQTTHNYVICGKLTLYADECYIAVASETGDFELCKNVMNASLSSNCIAAATSGKQKVEEEAARMAKANLGKNCAVDADCGVFGNANQYCAPKNTTSQFAGSADPLYACLKGVPCGCGAGRCEFAKNETYYACVNKLEDDALRAYINGLIPPDNSTAANGTSAANKTTGS